jgi:hypothetical protein
MYRIISFLLICPLFLHLNISAQPDNDLCSGSIDINELIGAEIGVLTQKGPFTNVDATGEEGLSNDLIETWWDYDSNGFMPSVDQTVWFHFTGDGNTYQFRTLNCPGAVFYSNDTQLALYSGSCDSLDLVGGNDDLMGFWSPEWGWCYSFINFKAEENVDYWLMVDGFNWNDGVTYQGVAEGAFCISSVQLTPLTDNNSCNSALAIDEILSATENNPSYVGPFDNTVLGSNIMPDENAEAIGIECWEDGPTEDGSVWFTFTGDGGSYTISPTHCNDDNLVYYWAWDAQMALYSGDCNELNPVACDEDYDSANSLYWPEIGVDTEDGVGYFVRMDGVHWANAGFDWVADGGFCMQAVAGNVNLVHENKLLEVSFYPNPCVGEITLDWIGENNNADIVAFDQSGKKVGVFLNVIKGQKINLNVAPGIYVLNIKSDHHIGSVTVNVLRE